MEPQKKHFLQGTPPAQVNKPGLFTAQTILVKCHDTNPELVELVVGNSVLTLHYTDGLQISQWLRVRSKEAKKKSGDNSRHWSAIGIIDNATPGG